MTATLDSSLATPADATGASFGHRLAPPGDPLEGASFDALYQTSIEPELVKREAERQAAMRIFLLAMAGAAAAVVAECLVTASLTHGAASVADWRIIMVTVVAAVSLGYLPLAD